MKVALSGETISLLYTELCIHCCALFYEIALLCHTVFCCIYFLIIVQLYRSSDAQSLNRIFAGCLDSEKIISGSTNYEHYSVCQNEKCTQVQNVSTSPDTLYRLSTFGKY